MTKRITENHQDDKPDKIPGSIVLKKKWDAALETVESFHTYPSKGLAPTASVETVSTVWNSMTFKWNNVQKLGSMDKIDYSLNIFIMDIALIVQCRELWIALYPNIRTPFADMWLPSIDGVDEERKETFGFDYRPLAIESKNRYGADCDRPSVDWFSWAKDYYFNVLQCVNCLVLDLGQKFFQFPHRAGKELLRVDVPDPLQVGCNHDALKELVRHAAKTLPPFDDLPSVVQALQEQMGDVIEASGIEFSSWYQMICDASEEVDRNIVWTEVSPAAFRLIAGTLSLPVFVYGLGTNTLFFQPLDGVEDEYNRIPSLALHLVVYYRNGTARFSGLVMPTSSVASLSPSDFHGAPFTPIKHTKHFAITRKEFFKEEPAPDVVEIVEAEPQQAPQPRVETPNPEAFEMVDWCSVTSGKVGGSRGRIDSTAEQREIVRKVIEESKNKEPWQQQVDTYNELCIAKVKDDPTTKAAYALIPTARTCHMLASDRAPFTAENWRSFRRAMSGHDEERISTVCRRRSRKPSLQARSHVASQASNQVRSVPGVMPKKRRTQQMPAKILSAKMNMPKMVITSGLVEGCGRDVGIGFQFHSYAFTLVLPFNNLLVLSNSQEDGTIILTRVRER